MHSQIVKLPARSKATTVASMEGRRPVTTSVLSYLNLHGRNTLEISRDVRKNNHSDEGAKLLIEGPKFQSVVGCDFVCFDQSCGVS